MTWRRNFLKNLLTTLFHNFFVFSNPCCKKVPSLPYSTIFSDLSHFFGKDFWLFRKRKPGSVIRTWISCDAARLVRCLRLKSLRCSFFSLVFYGIAANGSERAAPFPEQSSAVFSKKVFEKTVNDARITGVIHKCALRFLRDFLKRKSERVLRNSV